MVTAKELTTIPVIYQKVQEFEKEDSRFVQIRIWMMHTGENYNGSYFSKEVVDAAIPTLANTPVVAFLEENSNEDIDFSDHRIVLEHTDDDDIKLRYMGVPIGIIPESNNAHWQKRVADDGIEREYLVVDALLWTKWDDAIDIMKNKDGKVAHSMELSDDYSGRFDDEGLFHFKSFQFNGACLLGEDYLPAMEGSTAEIQFSKAVHKNIEDKLQEFYTLFAKENSQEGGTKVENEKVNEETQVTEQEFDKNEEEIKQEAKENAQVDDMEETPAATQLEEEKKDKADEQPLPEEQKPDSKEEEEFKPAEEQPVIKDDDAPTVDDEPSFEQKYNDAVKDNEALHAELEQLREFKRQTEESTIREKFSNRVTEDEFTQVFESMKDASVNEIEDKLFTIIGKKNFTTNPVREEKTNRMPVAPVEEKTNLPYGELLKGFEKK